MLNEFKHPGFVMVPDTANDKAHMVPCCKRCKAKHPTLLSISPASLFVRCEECRVQFSIRVPTEAA
jgi:mRNA-degrading endonuclease toxin of MazEF toxin-antitoxin module